MSWLIDYMNHLNHVTDGRLRKLCIGCQISGDKPQRISWEEFKSWDEVA